MRGAARVTAGFFFAVLFSTRVFAGDPRELRDLERETKASQARSMRRQLALADFASQQPQLTVEAYDFDLKLVPGEARLDGTVRIELTAATELRAVELDAVALDIGKAWFTDAAGARSEAAFESSAARVKVEFPAPVAPGARFALTFAYGVTGNRRDGRANAFERGLYAVNGDGSRSDLTPAVYTSVEPELARTWFPCFDDPSLKARRSRMRVTVPDGWTVVSNGALKEVVSHPEAKTSTFHWEERFPIPTYLISLAVSPYTVISDRWRDTPVQYFVPKSLVEKARVDFANTPRMIEEFSKLWAPYPYEKYAMATVPLYSGAMEHTSATTIADHHVAGDGEVEDTVAHELGHQWWGDMVTLAGWDDLWLNEGFATYAEVIFAERFKGSDAALESLAWNRDSYLAFDRDGSRAVVDPAVPPDAKFTPAVYEKGSWMLHMLRQALGDDAFFGGLRAYLKKFAFGNAGTDDLRKALEESSGRDLGDFFEQWVRGHGYPDLALKWSYDGAARAVTVSVAQKQSARVFQFPLEAAIAAKNAAGALVLLPLRLDIAAARQTFTQAVPAGFPEPVGLLVDPEMKILKKAEVERSLGELRFWLDARMERSWVARLDALEALAPAQVTVELAREVVERLDQEASAPVREKMLGVLASARKAKGFTAEDFERIQRAIRERLTDSSVEVRVQAALASREYLSPELTEYAAARFAGEDANRVKAALAATLAQAKFNRAFELFYGELQRSRQIPAGRKLLVALIEAFGRLGDPRAAAVLVDFVNGANPYFQIPALESLGSLAVPTTFDLIVSILRDASRSSELRISSARALANYGGIPAAKALSEQLQVEKDEDVKAAIKSALERLGGKPDFRRLSVTGSPASLRW